MSPDNEHNWLMIIIQIILDARTSASQVFTTNLDGHQATHVRAGSAITRNVMRRSQYICISVVRLFDAARPNAISSVPPHPSWNSAAEQITRGTNPT